MPAAENGTSGRKCLDCSASLEGKHGNVRRCEGCNEAHRKAYQREHWRKAHEVPERRAARNALRRKPARRKVQTDYMRDRYQRDPKFRASRKATAAKRKAGKNDRLRVLVALIVRQRAVCPLCMEVLPEDQRLIHLDHVVPLSAGGGDVVENLQATCGGCNVRKRGNLQ